MKIKSDFVTNSSSTSYIITNTSDTEKSLEDFILETWDVIRKCGSYTMYDFNYTVEDLLACVNEYDYTFKPNKSGLYIFGDNDYNVLGKVYDYVLREGGKTENFNWAVNEYLR